MSWVRIHDAALTHPKLVRFIDWRNPFCVWVWGLSYCQTHLTDGFIPVAAMPNTHAIRSAGSLMSAGLWEAREDGYQVHDYCDWNDTRDVVRQKRMDAKERMSRARSAQSVRANNSRTSSEVLRGVVTDHSSLKEMVASNLIVSTELADRAARFLERFDELYSQKMLGAKHFRRQPALDHTRAIDLCRTWDDERLDKIAVIFLTTNDEWISNTDRGLAVFAAKATYCDGLLSKWESQQKRSAS